MGAEPHLRHPIQTVESIRLAELICRRGDSNPHELPHTPLKRARLPVPPLRLDLLGDYHTENSSRESRNNTDCKSGPRGKCYFFFVSGLAFGFSPIDDFAPLP